MIRRQMKQIIPALRQGELGFFDGSLDWDKEQKRFSQTSQREYEFFSRRTLGGEKKESEIMSLRPRRNAGPLMLEKKPQSGESDHLWVERKGVRITDSFLGIKTEPAPGTTVRE